MKQKTIVTIALLGVVGYWIYTRTKAKKSLNPFAKTSSFTGDEFTYWDDAFSNAIGKVKGCQVFQGDVNVPVPKTLDNGDVIVKTGGGTTVVCPPNQQGGLGASSL